VTKTSGLNFCQGALNVVAAVMAPTGDEFSSPGSVNYDSETMVVGDGTWDFSKNTFLLPNLEGFNFDTMRYNGT
jgi:hypothetical protein